MGGAMRNFFKKDGRIYEFEPDGSQDHLITDGMIRLTEDEVFLHLNPVLTQAEKRLQMPFLKPAEFEIKLYQAGKYELVKDYIDTRANLPVQIAYNRATYYNRTDPFILVIMNDLNITDDEMDAIWESELKF
jgi:hypothetical protein